MTEKDSLLQTWEREFKTTLRVLKNIPQEKMDLRPSEKSRSTRDLAWTFVGEESVIGMALKGNVDFSNSPKAPENIQEIIDAYENIHREIIAKFKAASDADLNKTVKFPVAPKKMGDLRILDLAWTMVMDSVHHRGQLSVYLRLAGAKVPSIYGPSADEPWM